jgi:hypothetical protein
MWRLRSCASSWRSRRADGHLLGLYSSLKPRPVWHAVVPAAVSRARICPPELCTMPLRDLDEWSRHLSGCLDRVRVHRMNETELREDANPVIIAAAADLCGPSARRLTARRWCRSPRKLLHQVRARLGSGGSPRMCLGTSRHLNIGIASPPGRITRSHDNGAPRLRRCTLVGLSPQGGWPIDRR